MADRTPKDDEAVRVTLRPVSESPSEEWHDEFAEGAGGATTIDPDALKKLRVEESSPDMSDFAVLDKAAELPAESSTSSSPFEALSEDAQAEFDDQSMTVMDPRSVSEREAGDAPAALGNSPCPKCGVMVAPGYPKCPRCKAVLMEGAKAHRKTAGGTSLISRTIPWTIVFIAAVLTAIIYYLAERDPKVEGFDDEESGPSQLSESASSPDEGAADDEPAQEVDEPEDLDTEQDEEEDPGDEL